MRTSRLLRRLPSDVEMEAERCRRSFHAFVRVAWPVLEPHAPFVDNWHIGFLCEHLEAVHRGDIADLLINLPPGCMKSALVSVMFPGWEWTRRPELRYLCGSYDQQLATRDTRRMRQIVESRWYQARWPVSLRRDQNTKTRFDNDQGGWRIGTSVGGRGTGEHPHRKIIDDPHNVKQSLSAAARTEALTWFDLTLGSRGIALGAATIIIMQRLHEEDLSGHVLEALGDQFVHICLPMRYDPPAWIERRGARQLVPRMPPTPLGRTDPRTEPGELLWPSLFDAEKVAKVEAQLRAQHGEFGIAGQLQQQPVPASGGLFKREWFPIVDALPADVPILARCRGWDCAATEGGGDWSAGVRMARTREGLIYVEHVVRGQWGPQAFEGPKGILRQLAEADTGAVRIREEEEGGSAGKKVSAAHAHLLLGFDYRGEKATGDKVTRVRPFAAQAAVGNVRLVRGPWNQDYLDELCAFPNGRHDDQVDGSSVAFSAIALEPQNIVITRKLTGF